MTEEALKNGKEAKAKEDQDTAELNRNRKRLYGQRCVLVVHGQRSEDLESLQNFFDSDSVRCAVISREFGKNKIHPHWQVYFEMHQQVFLRAKLKEILGHDDFHGEVANGTKAACVSYVYAVDKEYEAGFIVYNKNCEVPRRYKPQVSEFWNSISLRPFQKEVVNITDEHANRRDIYYFWEEKGNTGKTILAEYLHIFRGAIITGGKSEDMKHAITRWKEITGHSPVTIIIDVARSDALNYDSCKAIEAIKNGLFFDGKYESAMSHSFEKPHVVIFANVPPKREYFSLDRWKVAKINSEFHTLEWE